MKKKISIEDLAKATGVSRGTVSRAFNERSDINKKTRQKVLDVARKLNYFPNPSARSLAKGRTECVGIVVPDLKNPFLPEMVSSIERLAKLKGFSALLATTGGDSAEQENILARMASGQVDGIIITPCEDRKSVATLNLTNKQLPVISLKHFSGLHCDSVMYNDRIGAFLIIEHLVKLGHRRIAFLSPKAPTWSVENRLQAYFEALDSLRLSFRMHIRTGDSLDEFVKLLKQIASNADFPTAIFAYDDIIALHAIKLIQLSGREVPYDISVAGFDNISFSSISSVPLTTISVNTQRLAETAMDLFFARLKKETREGELRHVTLTPELVARKSTGKPR